MIVPPFRAPNYLKMNGRVSLSIVVIHSLPVEEVVANDFRVWKSHSLCASPTFPFTLCFLSHPLIGAIGKHQRHDIVRLFHGIYVEMCIAHLSLPRITGADFLSIEVTSYLFSTNMFGPVSPLLDKRRCNNSIIFNSMIPLSMQNPLSRITTKDLLKIGLKIRNNNPTVFPRL